MRLPRAALLCLISCAPTAPHAQPRPFTKPPPLANSAASPAPLEYPSTKRDDVADVIHGMRVPDAYRWLENGDAPDVQTWMHAQDDLARAELAKLPARSAIAARLKELSRRDDQQLPVRMGGRLFYARRDANRERAVVYYRDDRDGLEHVLLDPDAWAADKSASLGSWSISWDGTKVAYDVRVHNRDAGTLRVIDVASGKISEVDVIEGVEAPYAQWTPSGDGFYYHKTPQDPALSPKRHELEDARFHKVGSDPARDVIVRAASVGQSGLRPVLSHNGRWLLVRVWRGESRVDVYYEDLREARPTWRTLTEGRDATYDVRVAADTFLVRSDDGAPNGQVFAVDPKKPARDAWRKLVPERPDLPLMGFDLLGGALILRFRKDDIAHVEIRDLSGALVRVLPSLGIGTTTFPSGTPVSDEAYYGFWSYDRPMEIYRTSITNGGDSLWYTPQVPFDRNRITVEQVFFVSKGGTRVPMFLVHAKDLKRTGNAPTMLYGYGGFNIANVPRFDPKIIPWVERGGVYALASLRGGSDYGETWHRAGMARNKQHVFDDFIAAAEYLVHEGYARPQRLAAIGASNGGLLVAAALVQRPDLFRAVLCGEPLADMVRFPLFGRSGMPEYGNPDDPDDFRALFAYSPYHHVVAGTRYPSVLITASVHDERANAMHARKFTAALQAATGERPVLLRVDWHAGHFGEDAVTAEAEKDAELMAFALGAMESGEGGR